MKKTIIYMLLLVFSLFSCSDNNPITEEIPDIISDVVSDIQFASISESKTITFTTNKSWEVKVDEPWCSISPTSGNAGNISLSVTTTENTGHEDREATLTIKTGNTTKNIEIIQRQKDAIIISKKDYEFTEEGGSFELEISTNVDLKVSIPQNIDWLHYNSDGTRSLSNKKLSFQVDKNTSYDSRECTITISDAENKINETIIVKQAQKNAIIVSKKEFKLNSERDSFEVEVKTNVVLKVSIPDNIDWVQYNSIGTRALTDKYLFFTVDKNSTYNERKCLITVTDEKNSVTDTLTIIQKGIIAKNINVTIPGTLKELLKDSITNIYELKITGVLSKVDFETFKEIPNLQKLDISEINIVDTQNTLVFYMFSGLENLKTINLPNSISTIAINALVNCNSLEQIIIPNSVKEIKEGAFHGNSSLITIDIPASVVSLAGNAFSYCHNLERINVSHDNTVYTDIDGVVTNKDKTKLISVPNKKAIEYNIPHTITEIGDNAFSYTHLTSLSIPNTVTKIGDSAFKGTWLTSIIVPNSVTEIGEEAFAFCRSLSSIILPDNITKIKRSTFYNCTGFTEISIPNSVLEIEDFAFLECQNLKTIAIPNSVKKIAGHVFSRCINIESIFIPNSVEYIGSGFLGNSFQSCTSLKEIIVSPENKYYSDIDGVLTNKDKTKLIKYPEAKGTEYTVPESIVEIGNHSFGWCVNMAKINISKNVIKIDDYAFQQCEELVSLIIPDNVTEIGDRAFESCRSLTYLTLSKNIKNIPYRTFNLCTGLREITMRPNIPPTGNGSIPYQNTITLYIPNGSKDAYQKSSYWNSFYQYIEQ